LRCAGLTFAASAPAGWRLHLPKEWTTERERCARAGVPPEIRFLEKWEIALALIHGLLAVDVQRDLRFLMIFPELVSATRWSPRCR
jgi:SRSO17 transposase